MTNPTEKTHIEIARELLAMNSRESYPFYVGASKDDLKEMLESLNFTEMSDLFSHLPSDVLFKDFSEIPHLNHEEIVLRMRDLSNKNRILTSFIGHGLASSTIPKVIGDICAIRGLTTAYTPYQPERSQGTLVTLWLYQSLMSELTGYEAINASFYERGTCLFEAMTCATRLSKSNKILVSKGVLETDLKVIETLAQYTPITIEYIELRNGQTDSTDLKTKLDANEYAAVVFSQNNSMGVIEDVDTLTNIIHAAHSKVIAIFDPLLIAQTGLKAPIEYGDKGADLIVAEAQHLCLAPNYGGPGLGVFGIRYNSEDTKSIRQSAGRFIGKTKDIKGQDCLTLVLSTREQHIRREKANSNICSNQSFVASIAGASLLARGSKGLNEACTKISTLSEKLTRELLAISGIELAFHAPFFNEVTFKINGDISELIKKAHKHNLELGVDLTHLCTFPALKISVNDSHSSEDIDKLVAFFMTEFKESKSDIGEGIPTLPMNYMRQRPLNILKVSESELLSYYQKLGALNLTPDEAIYPLGSCTMKYNPYINDWAASLPGFTNLHPEAHESHAQGSLELLYEIQNLFIKITGLHSVTTQPVAGAQGELVGLKLFQAYHNDRGEGLTRKYILIPQTAHGTNPATATMAGYQKEINGGGILIIKATSDGEMDIEQIRDYVTEYGQEIAGIMVTNPNTVGIFESKFKEMSEMIHGCGGLVYMDGANMNAIAGWVDLGAMGVDAVHNNLHKTWSIPHGGGGPGDAIVAVSEKLTDYLPGKQVRKNQAGVYEFFTPKKTIGSFHRHHGNFAHKVRCYTYLLALGSEGIKLMSAYSVLSARYIYKKLKPMADSLPKNSEHILRMHEFILTLSDEQFKKIELSGMKKTDIIPRIGKLFLDFGFHAPTVAFPEVFGLMIEPTESFTKKELDDFSDTVKAIFEFAITHPQTLTGAPHFAPIARVDELLANRQLSLSEPITGLPELPEDRISSQKLRNTPISEIYSMLLSQQALPQTHPEQRI